MNSIEKLLEEYNEYCFREFGEIRIDNVTTPLVVESLGIAYTEHYERHYPYSIEVEYDTVNQVKRTYIVYDTFTAVKNVTITYDEMVDEFSYDFDYFVDMEETEEKTLDTIQYFLLNRQDEKACLLMLEQDYRFELIN